MLFGLLNFGEGNLAQNYLVFCTVASLGVIQIVAARMRYIGLILLPAKLSGWLGAVLIVGAYAWFFVTQPDLFIPGLAGGELSTLSALGFVIALIIALTLGILSNRLFSAATYPAPPRRERVYLSKQTRAEIWLPRVSVPPLVIVLREARTDSLDVLAGELVARGAAVLLCDQSAAEVAYDYAVHHAHRFNHSRLYAIGAGRAANRALALATNEDLKLRAILALAPYPSQDAGRPGLRWLRETDFLTALRLSSRQKSVPTRRGASPALVVFGDEDTLIPPALARQAFPDAIVVAGARHLTLARMPAVLTLAIDWFELRAQPLTASARVPAPRRIIPGEITD